MSSEKNAATNGLEGVEAEIARFARTHQPALREFSGSSERARDLLYTFPAMALALATDWGDPRWTRRTRSQIESGASLRFAAQTIGLPFWLRKVPPEALHHGLPLTLSICYIDTAFGRSIVNAIPRDCPHGSRWLPLVQDARFSCDDGYALWLAKRSEVASTKLKTEAARVIAAYAWYSAHPHVAGAAFLDRPWSEAMSFATALENARDWFTALCLRCAPPRNATREQLKAPAQTANLDLVPLLTESDLLEEAEAMDNCLARYAGRLAYRASYLYSVRRDGVRLACLELMFDEAGLPEISEFAGFANGRVDPETHRAVSAWVEALRHSVTFKGPGQSLRPERWAYFLRPYWASVGERAPFRQTPVLTEAADVATQLSAA